MNSLPRAICCLLAALVCAPGLAAEPVAPVLTQEQLYQKLLDLDTAMFDSFNKCSDPAELRKNAAFFDKDVEFYHDNGGFSLGVDSMIEATRKNVCGKFHRELVQGSFRVFPIPGYGAMSIGTHRFCHTPTTCEGEAEFTMVWHETGGRWVITRALSYGHRGLEPPAPSTMPAAAASTKK